MSKKDENKRRNKRVKQQTPVWLSRGHREWVNSMRKFAPADHSVDHIVPLQGLTVSGLNVPWNMQYLSKEENSNKGNRWPSDLCWTLEQLQVLFGFGGERLPTPRAPIGCFRSHRKKT